jgi:hypothetical protein
MLFFFTLLLFNHAAMSDQLPEFIEFQPNTTIEVEGDLADGAPLSDLSWAWNSSNACFPETQKAKFTGNHFLYYIDLPSYTEMEITVIPADKKANFSLYAYEVGQVDESNTVPNLASCVRCEADHKWDRPRRGKTQDHTRTVRNILALRNPYQVVIGVAGAEGLDEGAFTLRITTKGR